MAGDWIKMRMDLPEDPAVYRLARITGLDRLSVVGRLYAFWAWADKHAVDGHVDGGATADVDDIVRHDGFADAMAQVKWLEIGNGFLAIPKHDRHNGESAKERSLKNQRQARWREKRDVEPSTPASTKPSTREEKRREERETTPSGVELVGFAAFWQAWPPSDRKQAKGKCLEAWKKAKAEAHAALVIAHVERMKNSPGWTKQGGEFIPAPLVYLNNRAWEGAETTAPVQQSVLAGAL